MLKKIEIKCQNGKTDLFSNCFLTTYHFFIIFIMPLQSVSVFFKSPLWVYTH